VLLNGAVPKASAAVATGDVLDYTIAEPEVLTAHAEALPLTILYEDDA
jgi:23S rRNA-/tRNA-specific pseudouridylate synthase